MPSEQELQEIHLKCSAVLLEDMKTEADFKRLIFIFLLSLLIFVY